MNCNTLQLKGRVDPLCIVADDSVYLALVTIHLSKTSHVISLFPGLRDKGLQYLQAIADSNGFSMNRVEVLEKKKTCLTMHDTHQRKVSVFQISLSAILQGFYNAYKFSSVSEMAILVDLLC